MKQRIPGSIFIPLTLFLILTGFLMVIPADFTPKQGFEGFFYNSWHQITNVLSYWIVWVVLILSFLLLMVIDNINKVVERRNFAKLTPLDQARYIEESKIGYFRRLIRSSAERQSDEVEEEIVLDHGFDGILELDNALPQWWLAMFYLGIIYCAIYIIAYFTTDFADQHLEYEVETARLETQFASWVKANDITFDQADMANASMENGEEIFSNLCATCHLANGGGAAGPNLTDNAWVNVLDYDLYKNIYMVVYDGSPNNPAMQAFGQTNQLTGLDIQDVSAYVHYLNQEAPIVTQDEGGLGPQGEVVYSWERN